MGAGVFQTAFTAVQCWVARMPPNVSARESLVTSRAEPMVVVTCAMRIGVHLSKNQIHCADVLAVCKPSSGFCDPQPTVVCHSATVTKKVCKDKRKLKPRMAVDIALRDHFARPAPTPTLHHKRGKPCANIHRAKVLQKTTGQ